MPQDEEILGDIEYVKGGHATWEGYHNIILTNKRVIIASISTFSMDRDMKTLMKTNWKDIFNPLKEMVDVEKIMMQSLDEILSKKKSTYIIRYNEMKNLKFSKEFMEIIVSFSAHNRRFTFRFPSSQHRSANRWNQIYNRLNHMNSCPRCQGKLQLWDSGALFCGNCNLNYKMNISDFRYDYQVEKRDRMVFKNKSTGALLAVFGMIFFISIYLTFYSLAQRGYLSPSDTISGSGGISIPIGIMVPCSFIFPLFIIITGVLIYTGTNSGKIMFGILCILFGLACYIAVIIAYINNEEGAIGLELILSGVGTAMISYGVLLIRNSSKKKIQYNLSNR
jgi:hypothetical protein